MSRQVASKSSSSNEPVYLIDASIFIFKYYFSMPTRWFASNGRPTETVYGYARWLLNLLLRENPKRITVCFDESLSSCFRNDIYPDYKSNRALPDEDLAFQLIACKHITELLGVSAHASEVYEADDLIGSFALYCHKRKLPYRVLTRDKDLSQLIFNSEAALWDYPDGAQLYHDDIVANMGVTPSQVPDYLALVGDASDNIPGVPGSGPKTAVALLSEMSDWHTIRDNLDQVSELSIRGAKKLSEKLEDYRSQVDMALRLTTIATEAHKPRATELKRSKVDVSSLQVFCEELGFPEGFMKKVKEEL